MGLYLNGRSINIVIDKDLNGTNRPLFAPLNQLKPKTMADGAADGPAGESTAVAEPKQPHRLERKWTFWFDNQSKPKVGAAWGSSLRKIYTFDTVEEFWWYVCVFLSFSFIIGYNNNLD